MAGSPKSGMRFLSRVDSPSGRIGLSGSERATRLAPLAPSPSARQSRGTREPEFRLLRVERKGARIPVTAILISLALFLLLAAPATAQKQNLDEMSLQRWAKLREVERHQLQIAEKYYREQNWKVAAAEYDKYLNLYEASDAASHALLKWSLCHVNLRQQNTAINDGFRSVIDYWPDSEDAIASAYYIGKTLKDIGQVHKAKPALSELVEQHPKHLAGVYAMVALADIAAIEKDQDAQVKAWSKLTFDAPRNKQTRNSCIDASVRLASHLFSAGNLTDAVAALATTYDEKQLSGQVVSRASGALRSLVSSQETEAKGQRLADQLISYLRGQEPEDLSSEQSKAEARNLCYLIADVHRDAGRDDQVLKVYGEIAKRFGSDDTLLARTAAWHKSHKDYDQARAAYRKFDNKIGGLSEIAISYREEKDLTSAISTYAKLASVDTEDPVRWKAESATTYRQFGKHAEAIEVYQELLQQDPGNGGRWLWEIATTYRDAGKWKEAIGFYRQTDRFPDNYREMAACHRRLKQHSEAVILYNQIAGGHKPSAPWALLQVGYTQEEAGQKDKAIASFKQVCKLFPKDAHASQAHAHLQNKYKLSVTLGGTKDE